MHSFDFQIADFFRQLSLLTSSELPVPEAVKQLADCYKNRSFRNTLTALSESTSAGKTLSEAMKEHPDIFKPFHIRMIALGETEGTMPEILDELARMGRLQYLLVNMIKDIMLYPFVTITVAGIIMLVIGGKVMVGFRQMYGDLLEGVRIPMLTKLSFETSDFISDNFNILAALMGCWILFMLWIFMSRKYSHKLLLGLVRHFPYSEIVFYNFAMSRFCQMWGTMIKRKIPAEEGFPVIARVSDFTPANRELLDITEKCRAGSDVKQCLKDSQVISSLISTIVEKSKEEKLPEELDKLSELFRERGYYGYRRMAVAWETISFIGMVIAAVICMMIMFLPFLARLFY